MPRVEKTALVMHSAEQMYGLVNDIDRYQDFLPWCESSRVLSREGDQMCGEMVIARAGIRQAFTTCNTLAPHRSVHLYLKEGPFSHLQGEWAFTPLREDACKVSLTLEFAFSGKLINAAFGAIFAQIADNMVDAFCKRADALYGDGSAH